MDVIESCIHKIQYIYVGVCIKLLMSVIESEFYLDKESEEAIVELDGDI